MICELEASCVIENKALERTVSGFNDSPDDGGTPLRGVLGSGRDHTWIWKESRLDVWSRKSSESYLPLGEFNFAQIFGDGSLRISSVIELADCFKGLASKTSSKLLLLVALSRNSSGSLLCVVDPRLSRILKLIESPFKIASLSCLEAYGNSGRGVLNFAEQLKIMRGIVVAGTENGLVVFIDLCVDVTTAPDLLAPNKVKFLVKQPPGGSRTTDPTSSRKVALIHDQHICLPLNSDAHGKGKFMYRAADGSVLDKFPNQLVSVTSAEYIFQLNTLCVGFNFGGFQLWNMSTLLLECSCSLENDLPPVIRFTFQEPENDPKNYCYLWVVRGTEAGIMDNQHIVYPSAAYLFALAFRVKQWVPGFGYLYSDFDTCACRFDYQMTTNAISGPSAAYKSYLISCETVYQASQMHLKTYEDEGGYVDTSLCLFAWEAWVEKSSNQSCTYFALFDLNQWYQAQMPPFVDAGYYNLHCPFLGLYTLSDVTNIALPDALLQVSLLPETITTYRARQNYSEINYYPSSLSFNISVLTENRVLVVNYLGIQRRCLSQMTTAGPVALLEPLTLVRCCVASGVLSTEKLSLSVALQREALLTLALENDQVAFIIKVIEAWSSGEFNNIGCNCRFILEWIWKHVSSIKSSIDRLTEPLFADGEKLDDQILEQLNSYETDLRSLNVFLRNLELVGTPTTDQGSTELKTRIEVTELISSYLRMLLWFYSCGLLPQYLEGEEVGEQDVVFPYSSLDETYNAWRKQLCSINPGVLKSKDLLIIDAVIENLSSVSLIWKEAGGNGMYPPPSLHSVLGIYLIESCPLDLKNFVVLYFLLDMATYLSECQSEIADKIKLFPAAFHLKPGLTKLVQGIWALDHKSFDYAVKTLCDPSVQQILCDDHSAVSGVYNVIQEQILTTLLYQGYHRHAQMYLTLSNLMSLDSPAKEKLHVSVLLSNCKLLQAFHFQRQCRNGSTAEELLLHFFLACEQMKLIEEVFKLPLDLTEEDALIYYLLHVSPSPNSKLLLCLYFVVNNKVIDAANFMHIYRATETLLDENLVTKSEQLTEFISAHVAALPKTLSRLAEEVATSKFIGAEAGKYRSEAAPVKLRPSPALKEAVGTSDAVRSLLEQVEEADEVVRLAETLRPAELTPFRKKLVDKGLLVVQKSPFLRPTMSKAQKNRRSSNYGPGDATYAAMDSTLTADQPMDETVPLKRSKEDSAVAGQEILSLLATPSINRKPKSSLRRPEVRALQRFTPTSILKNHSSRRPVKPPSASASPSTPNKSQKGDAVRNRLRFSIPISPLVSRETKYDTPRRSSKTANVSTAEQNKHPEAHEEFFSFSPPIDRNDGHRGDYQRVTPNYSSFVFSPPLTRSRSKAKTVPEKSNLEKLLPTTTTTEQITSSTPRRVQAPTHRMQLRTSSTKKKATKSK